MQHFYILNLDLFGRVYAMDRSILLSQPFLSIKKYIKLSQIT